MTDVDEHGLQTYDAMLNTTRHMPWRVFSDRWYGYVIVPTQLTNWNNQQLMASAIGIHSVLVVFVVASLAPKTRSLLIKTSAAMRLFVTAFIMIVFGLSHPRNAAAEELLRSSLNDGTNAAALLGGIYGAEIPPDRPGGAARIDSLRDIQLQLQAHGLAASVQFLGYDALAFRNLPCVVPLRFGNNEVSSFCIFIQADDSDVYLVAAGPLIARTLSVDDFRRYWTGYAVFCDRTDAYYRDWVVWALFGCVFAYGSFIYSWRACRRHLLPVRRA